MFVVKRRKEVNPFFKKGRPSDLKVGVFIPLPYKAAMSSTFMHMAYTFLNEIEGVSAYRYVYNFEEDVVEALDSNLPFNKLDVLLTSTSFELDYVTLARVLLMFNLLPKIKGGSKPLVIVGGIASTANPLPLVGIADAVVLGEGEAFLEKLPEVLTVSNPLEALSELDFVFTFSTDVVKRKYFVNDLNSSYYPKTQIHSLEEEPIYGHGLRIEVSRGCKRFCAFCMEGHVLNPFRFRSFNTLKNIVEDGLKHSPVRRVVIYSLSFFDVPHADAFLNYLINESIEASIPSLRPDYLTLNRLEAIKALGQKTLTIAPETLDRHVGCLIGKCIDQETLSDVISNAYRLGFNHIKMYFIEGFTEEGFIENVLRLKDLINKVVSELNIKKRKFFRITVNPLIPKPWTPYQYLPPASVLNLKEALKLYASKLESKYVEVETYDVNWGFAQSVIALGNEGISDLIIEWARNGLGISSFKRALRNVDLSRFKYIWHGWENPPWVDRVDVGINVKYLATRFKILKNKILLKS